MAEFAVLERDLLRKIVTQGLEIYFKYTGQPVQCNRCNSSEHTVKDCPKKRRRPPPVRDLVAETRGRVLRPPHPLTLTARTWKSWLPCPNLRRLRCLQQVHLVNHSLERHQLRRCNPGAFARLASERRQQETSPLVSGKG